MGYNTKNYTEQGGEKTVIGGELKMDNDGIITFGGVPLRPAGGQAVSTATTVSGLKDEFNVLLAKLQKAGLMERAFVAIEADSETDNKINTLTTYTNVDGEPDAWVVDVIIASSELIPAGTKVTINNPNIGGTFYEVVTATRTLWLSDIIKAHNKDAPARTKLNIQTTQAFDFTVSGLEDDFTTNLTLQVVMAGADNLTGTCQSEMDFGEFVIMTTAKVNDITFIADKTE